jgi:hypothetical protein
MKTIKKVFKILAIGYFVFSLAGCNFAEEENSSNTSNNPTIELFTTDKFEYNVLEDIFFTYSIKSDASLKEVYIDTDILSDSDNDGNTANDKDLVPTNLYGTQLTLQDGHSFSGNKTARLIAINYSNKFSSQDIIMTILDNVIPTISLSTNKPIYFPNEDIIFSGSTTDSEGLEDQGIDIYANDGTSDQDLDSLTTTLIGGLNSTEKYQDFKGVIITATGWSQDINGNTNSTQIIIKQTPFSDLSDIVNNIDDLSSYQSIGDTYTFEFFENNIKPILSSAAFNAYNNLVNQLSSSEEIASYHLTDSGLIVEFNILDNSRYVGFSENKFYGQFDLNTDVITEINHLLYNIPNETEAIEVVRRSFLTMDNYNVVLDTTMRLFEFGNVTGIDIVGNYTTTNGQEINIGMEFLNYTNGDDMSSENLSRIESFNQDPIYMPIEIRTINTPMKFYEILQLMYERFDHHEQRNPSL